MKTPRPSLSLLATLTLGGAALAPPARAQVMPNDTYGRASDVQGYNLAGGTNYVEGYWPVYARLRTYDDTNPTTLAGVAAGTQASRDTEVQSTADASYGAEVRFNLPKSVPWFFVTGEYRRARYDEFRVRAGNGRRTGYQDIGDGTVRADIGRAGFGVAVPNTPFYGRVEYSSVKIDGLGVNNRYDGFGFHGGFAQPITRFLGVRAEAGYLTQEDLGDGFEWTAGLNLNLTPNVALTGAYRSAQLHGGHTNARIEDATAGLRFQFAQ